MAPTCVSHCCCHCAAAGGSACTHGTTLDAVHQPHVGCRACKTYLQSIIALLTNCDHQLAPTCVLAAENSACRSDSLSCSSAALALRSCMALFGQEELPGRLGAAAWMARW